MSTHQMLNALVHFYLYWVNYLQHRRMQKMQQARSGSRLCVPGVDKDLALFLLLGHEFC
jgi:hypothetical protein